MRAIHVAFAFVLVPLATACLGQTPAARGQEAANELNTNQRFGRIELLAERVSDKEREKFFERRKSWGARIQIADSEMLSFKMRGESEADVMVRVNWYKVDEGDLHATTLKQSWKDFKGTWKLTSEDRADGDAGLLGEPVLPAASAAKTQEPPPAQAKNAARFQTVRLGQPEEPTTMASSVEEAPAQPSSDAPAAPPSREAKPQVTSETKTEAKPESK